MSTLWKRNSRKYFANEAPHNPEVEGSNPSPATTLCDQKRYRTGKPRSRNGFGVFSRPFLTARKKDIFPPLPRAVRT